MTDWLTDCLSARLTVVCLSFLRIKSRAEGTPTTQQKDGFQPIIKGTSHCIMHIYMHVRNIARGVEAHRGGKITRRFTMAPEPARVLHNCGLRCPDHQPPHYRTSASALPRCYNTAVYRVQSLHYRKTQRGKTHPGITSFFSIYLRCHLAVTLQEATQHRRPIELQKRFVFARRPLFFFLLPPPSLSPAASRVKKK